MSTQCALREEGATCTWHWVWMRVPRHGVATRFHNASFACRNTTDMYIYKDMQCTVCKVQTDALT